MILSGGTIKLPSFLQGVLYNQIGIGSVLPDIAFRDDNDILGKTESPHAAVDLLRGPASVGTVRHDHQHIKVAMATHLSSGGRTKKDDAKRVNGLDDADEAR